MSGPTPTATEGKKGGKKKLMILVAAVLLLGGGGAGAWFSGVLPRLLGKGDAVAAEAHGAEPAKPSAHGAKPEPAKAEAGGHAAKPAAPAHGAKPAETAKGEGSSPFMDLPDIVANLNGGPRRTVLGAVRLARPRVFVKLKAKLELARPEDQAALQAAMPRLLDLFQGYLREMRPEELRGSGGTYRLREELLARTNLAAPPARATSVLFTEVLIQ